MRFDDLFESRDEFPGLRNNPYDDESGLYLNDPKDWSKSPYLGAVVGKGGNGYVAQIHIPQAVWQDVIESNYGKWRKSSLPDTFYNSSGKNRSALRVGPFKDPRHAAWIVQTILYGTHDTAELIDDFLTAKYIDNQKGSSAWRDIISTMPKFSGEVLELADRETWFKKHEEQQKQDQMNSNKDQLYANAPAKIEKVFLKALADHGKKLKRNVFGNASISMNQIKDAVSKAVNELGVQHFMQGVNVKDPLGFDLSKFA